MARNTGQGWFARLGDVLSDPLGEFLESLWGNLWVGRVVFGSGLLISPVWSNWSMTGLFAGLWALLEGIHVLLRWWRGQGRRTE